MTLDVCLWLSVSCTSWYGSEDKKTCLTKELGRIGEMSRSSESLKKSILSSLFPSLFVSLFSLDSLCCTPNLVLLYLACHFRQLGKSRLRSFNNFYGLIEGTLWV